MYEYYSDGRINQITTEDGVTTYSYNSGKRVDSIVYPDGSHTDYEYYSGYRRKKVTKHNADGTSSIQEWTYYGSSWRRKTYKTVDTEGNETLYEYNYNGRLARVTDPDGVVGTYTYNAEGRIARIDYSNGNYETRTYVPDSWRTDTITRYYSGDDTTYTESYTYHDDRYTVETKTVSERSGDTTYECTGDT